MLSFQADGHVTVSSHSQHPYVNFTAKLPAPIQSKPIREEKAVNTSFAGKGRAV